MRNFDFKPNVDMASIASLFQRKAQMEQDSKLQAEQITASKQNRMLEIVNLATNMPEKMINRKIKQQQLEAQAAVNTTLGKQNDLVPGSETGTATVAGLGEVPTVNSVPFGQTPEFKTELQQNLQNAAPEEMQKALIKQMVEGQTGELTRANAPQDRPMISQKSGKRVMAVWDPKKAQHTVGGVVLDPTEWIRDYKADLRSNPESEELTMYNQAGVGKTLSGGKDFKPGEKAKSLKELPVIDKTETRAAQDKFKADPTVKLLSGDLSSVQVLKDLIAKRPKGAVGLTRTQLTVFAGEKGRLTDEDIMRNAGAPDAGSRLVRTYNDLVNGNLSSVDSKDFKIIVEMVEQKKAQELDLILNDYVDNIGLEDPSATRDFARGYIGKGLVYKIDRTLKQGKYDLKVSQQNDALSQLAEIQSKLDEMEQRRQRR